MDSEEFQRLDGELRALHGGQDAARLTQLHIEAADLMNALGAQRFHLTHAWIYALVAGDHLLTAKLEHRLRDLGGL